MPLILSGNVASATAEAYEVANSCRFNDGDSAHMHRTNGSTGSQTTWTFSCWVKRGVVGSQQDIFVSLDDASNYTHLRIKSDDTVELDNIVSGSNTARLTTNRVLRDVGAWYNLIWVADTTNATAGNRIRLYINGTEETDFGTDTQPDQNTALFLNQNKKHTLGRNEYSSGSSYFDGYLAEVCFIDGTDYAATSFGEFDDDSPRIWKPIDVSGLTFGTNGFYLDMEKDGTSTAFVDSSSNARAITVTGGVDHSFTQAKFNNSSIYFDGTNDSLDIEDSSDFDFGTGNFTFECWIYKTSSGKQAIFETRSSSDNDGFNLEFDANNKFSWYDPSIASGGDLPKDSNAITLNTWTHYAVVRNGDTCTMYKDGTSVGTPKDVGSNSQVSAGTPTIGESAGGINDFQGYLDDIRLSSTARYTSNFTAPTSTFTSDSDTVLLIQSKASNLISADVSGQGNHFSTSNITIEDQCVDSPTNNFATFNSLIDKGITYSEGNVHYKNTHGSNSEYTHPTIQEVENGRWYYEIRMASGNNDSQYEYFGNGTAYVRTDDNIHPSGSTTVSSGDIFGFYLNYEDGQVTIHRNGSQIYQSSSGISLSTTVAQIAAFNNTEYQVNFGNPSYSISSGNADANGYGNFEYSPTLSSVNFYSLCTKNLAEYG